MNTRIRRMISAVVALALAGMVSMTSAYAADKEKAAEATGAKVDYKIAIVDTKAVITGYNKAKDEYKQLQADVDVRQKEIDKLSEQIDSAKKKYEAERETLSTEQRADREAAIQSDYANYKKELDSQQAVVDSKLQAIMKKAAEAVNTAVKKIGETENYHIIFGSSGVMYHSAQVDISSRVIDELNKSK